MDFIKTESVQVFDIDKIRPGSIAMLHFYNGDRYGIITHVTPDIISVRCEDTVTRDIEAKRAKNGKNGFESEEDVLVDIITPEEMHHIFERRAAPAKGKLGYAHNVGMNPISGKNLDLARNIMCNLAHSGNKKAAFFLIDSRNGKLEAHTIYEHICKEAYYTIRICTDEDLEQAIRKTTLNWLDTNMPLVKEPSDDDAVSMYKVIEECASEGNIIAQAFLQSYDEQNEDKCKINDEDLGKMWRAAGESHDKAKNFWSLVMTMRTIKEIKAEIAEKKS